MTQLGGFKFVTTLVIVFEKKESKNKTKYGNFYSSSKTKTITNESNSDNVFQSIYTTIIENLWKSSLKHSGRIIDLDIDHSMSISKYNPFAGISYIICLKN